VLLYYTSLSSKGAVAKVTENRWHQTEIERYFAGSTEKVCRVRH